MQVRSILCPVDLSEQSGQALLWASAIAQRRGAELTVASVVDPLLVQAAGVRLGMDLAREEAVPSLRAFVEGTLPERLRRELPVRLEVPVGTPSDAILQAARRLDPSLIVMGTLGLGGLRKLLLGSTTEEVLRRTAWPVLAVPPGAVSARAAEHPDALLNRILIATDLQASGMAALQWAADLASEIRVPLLVVHVVAPVTLPSRWAALAGEFDGDRVSSCQRLLARLCTTLPGVRAECVVTVGSAAETIPAMAVEHGAGLVVMGLDRPADAGGRSPGSIAYRVLRAGHAALVAVPVTPAHEAAGRGTHAAQPALAAQNRRRD